MGIKRERPRCLRLFGDLNADWIKFLPRHENEVEVSVTAEKLSVCQRDVLDQKGGPTSGHWAHDGRPGKRGGSAPGGGFSRIGATSDTPANEVRRLADYHHTVEREFYPDISKEVRQASYHALRECLSHGRVEGNEKAVLIHADGRVIFTKGGNENSVMFQPEDIDSTQILVHNHPSGGSFSMEDLSFLYLYPTIEHLLVAGGDGTLYRMSRTSDVPSDPEPLWRKICDVYFESDSRYHRIFGPIVRSGRMSTHDASREHIHSCMADIAAQFDLDYERVVPPHLDDVVNGVYETVNDFWRAVPELHLERR